MNITFKDLPTALDACINSIIKTIDEDRERTLAEIIANYDFIVSSIECKHALMSILPEEASIIVTSRFIEEPSTIFAIKKFHIIDYYRYLHESEVNNDNQG